MKKIIVFLALGAISLGYSQVRIGKSVATSLSSPSVLLEFGDEGNKGLILPYVETVPTDAVGGTLIFDVSAAGEYKVKVKNENAGWTDFSIESGYSTAVETDVKTPQKTPLADRAGAKVIIGASTTSTPGIVVLESANKAMVLPIVSSYDQVPNPSAGMMVYINKTGAKRLAVFNGQKWTFWKP